jgi:hypothetical protein
MGKEYWFPALLDYVPVLCFIRHQAVRNEFNTVKGPVDTSKFINALKTVRQNSHKPAQGLPKNKNVDCETTILIPMTIITDLRYFADSLGYFF